MRRFNLLVALLLLGTTLAAATPTLVSVDVLTLNNDATTPLGDEDTAIVVPYTLLSTAAQGAANYDSFRISAITPGSTLEIQVGGVSNPGNPWATAVFPCLVTAADHLRWTPPLNANGDRAAWTLRARDSVTNTNSASDVGVTIKVNPVTDSIALLPVAVTPIPIVRGVATTFTYEQLRGYTDFVDPDGDAYLELFFDFGVVPTAGWKAEHLTSSGEVVPADTATGAAQVYYYLRRDEYMRMTISDLPGGTIVLGVGTFRPGTVVSRTVYFDWKYTISDPPVGNADDKEDGGFLGGCGAGTAGMSLVIALFVLPLRRRRRA